MKTVVLLTKDEEIQTTVETYCLKQGLSLQLPASSDDFLVQCNKKNGGRLAILDLDDLSLLLPEEIGGLIALGQPAIIADQIAQLEWCEDIIPKPVMSGVLALKLNRVIKHLDESKNAREEIERLNADVDDAYALWEKTDRVLRASLKEIEKDRNNLKELNQQLERLDKMRSEFLTTVSHELKTPLSSIKAFTEILLDDEMEPAEVAEFLEIINGESDRLNRLINNLLMSSRIESGKVYWKMDAVSIAKVVKKSANAVQLDIKEKGLRLEINIPPDISDVSGDMDRLVDVVDNLLSNAINFTPSGGTIKLNAVEQMAADKGLEILVSIQDTGVGIKREEQEKIFDKFYQIKKDILTDKPKGMGLGLAICKEIVEHHNGRIWVESQPGKGSTFSFSLPAKKVDGNNSLTA